MVSISQGSVNTMESIAGMAQVAPTVVTPANRPPLGWTTATNYWQGDQVQHFGRRYVCVTAGVSGAGPTGVGINIPDGSARWNFFGNANSGSILTPLQATNRVGDDIILSNVISFEIKPTWHGAVGPRGYGFPTITAPGNYDIYGPTNMTSTEYPFDTLGAFQNARYEFDSLMPTSTHPQARMNAMQIRIRVYDIKVKTARQMTLIVDL